MSRKLKTISLGAIADVYSGYAFKSTDLASDGEFPVIKIANIQDKMVRKECATSLPANRMSSKLDRFRLRRGDVLVAMTGAGSVGKIGRMRTIDRPYLVNQRVGIIRVKDASVDPDYLYHVLSLDDYERVLFGYGLGAGQPNVSPGQVGALDIPLMSTATQRKIGSMLSAYDDLIENNTRRIAILEEMAQAIYREWFVNFRFPSHKDVKIVDSSLGKIPEGWEVLPMGSICSRITDGAHTSPKSVDEGLPMASVKDMEHWRFDLSKARRIDVDEFAKLVKQDCKPLKGDVLIAKDGSYLKHAFVAESDLDVVLLSSIAILRSNGKLEPHLLTFILREPQTKRRLANYVSGVAIPRIILKDFARFEVFVPPESLQQLWWNHVQPTVELIHCLLRKNDHLRTTRDLLRPKLISGQLHVDDLDIDLGVTANELQETTA